MDTTVLQKTSNVPEVIGDYRIQDEIGRGAMSHVYRAVAPDGRPVALKVPNPEVLARDWEPARLRLEARLTAGFNHPAVVGFVGDTTLDDGRVVLALELVEGRTLDRLVGWQGLDVDVALDYAVQIGEALAAVHDADVVHCDLKPQNVLVDENGRVRLIDFGLARRIRTRDGSDLPKGTLAGTPAYMSPEQVEGRPLDARSDVFAFGALLYSMLAGRSPFRARTMLGVLSKVMTQEPDDLASWRGDLPVAVARVIHKAMAKDRRKRYATVRQMLAALDVARRPQPAPERRAPFWRVAAEAAFGRVAATVGLVAVTVGLTAAAGLNV